jgi:uncharacterized protein
LNVVVNYNSFGQKHGTFMEYYYRIPETHEFEYKNGMLDGPAFWRHFDGNILIQGFYTNNQRTGEWKWFWPNEVLQAIGMMADSTFQGKWKYYHDDGTKDSEGEFDGGKRTGLWKFYWKGTGKIKVTGSFKNDEMFGTWRYFDETGAMIREEHYTF